MRELQTRMGMDEYHAWARFYARYPFDDFHRYQRPAALVAQTIGGGEMDVKLDWLAQRDDHPTPWMSAQFSEADMKTFKAFGVKPPGMGV